MRFAVETWDPAYGSAIESLDLEHAASAVDAAIEVPPERWAPIPCADRAAARCDTPMWFVDGVRRIDARVWIADAAAGAKPGVCASVAAGSVRVGDGAAEVADVVVARGLYVTPNGSESIVTGAGRYELRACGDDTPEAVYLAIHQHMTELEVRVTAAADADDIVIVDGPLRGRSGERTVGYVKTHHVQYLTGEAQGVLARTATGDRTPLFLLGGHQARYSWYVRLPGARPHPLACVVRCEMPAVGDVDGAGERASDVTAALLRFASEPHKDARAPQNLYPIAGLEHRLRHLLGDARLLERALRAAGSSTPITSRV